VIPSNTIDGKGLMFSNEDHGLPWPITDPRDIDIRLLHGLHCMQMALVPFTKQSPLTDMDRFHAQHCKDGLRKVNSFLQSQNDFSIPDVLCKSLRSAYNAGPDGIRFQVDREPFVVDRIYDGNSPDYLSAVYSCHKYTEFVPPENLTEALLSNYVHNLITAPPAARRTQAILMGTLMGQNLESVLVKEYAQQPLTDAERAFIELWHSEDVVPWSAMGIYCTVGKGGKVAVATLNKIMQVIDTK